MRINVRKSEINRTKRLDGIRITRALHLYISPDTFDYDPCNALREFMMKIIALITLLLTSSISPVAQTTAAAQTPAPQQSGTDLRLSDYGVSFDVEPRLIVMMAALEAAGFDPLPASAEPSLFRAQVRRDLLQLDPDLQRRLRSFYERNRLPAPATAADQAARYISLAFVVGPAPSFEAPARSEELPSSLLEVLDFAPLVKEFYRAAKMEQLLPNYIKAYQAESDRLRRPTADMIRSVLSYLHTRPITISVERVAVRPTVTPKKNAPKQYSTRQRLRRFSVVPDLLGATGTVNFRVIGDDYYAVLPEETDPASSELRRAYLQYVVDPIVLRFNRETAERRDQIKAVISEREKAGATISPDAFLAVSRSLVAAADARYEEARKLESLRQEAAIKIAAAKDIASRQAISREFQANIKVAEDETIARLADDYERGAILAFFFAEQLKGIESSGFDVAGFFADMVASFDPVREARRLTEHAEARRRALAARQARLAARRAEVVTPVYSEAEAARAAMLVKNLGEIEQILKAKNYPAAETRLKDLLREYSREPRIFFALAQTASLAATDAIDEDVQAERLNRALGNYRLAIEASSPETDRALISRAHEAMGRIHAFLDHTAEASQEFDAAIKIGDVPGGAFRDAVEGKRKLGAPK